MINKEKYQEVGGGLNVDRMWSNKDNPLKVGASIEGRYVEKKTGLGTRGNSSVYTIEVGSEKVGVWGTTVLDGRFEKIAIGKMVAIEYLGLAKTKDGKGEYKDFWVGQGIDIVGDEGGKAKPNVSGEDEISMEDLSF